MRLLTIDEPDLVSGGYTTWRADPPNAWGGFNSYDDFGGVPGGGSYFGNIGASLVGVSWYGFAAAAPVAEPPIVVTGTRGSDVTVQTTAPLSFSGNIPNIPFSGIPGGAVSGTIPAGATFTGPDKNSNNIPDVLDRMFRDGTLRESRANGNVRER